MANLIIKIMAPLGVVLMPVFLLLLWRAPNPPGPDHASIQFVFLMNAIGLVGWAACIYLCHRYLGWFGGKKTK